MSHFAKKLIAKKMTIAKKIKCLKRHPYLNAMHSKAPVQDVLKRIKLEQRTKTRGKQNQKR